MRASQKDMARNHERIVEGAARLVRRRGIEGAGVAEVMREAGLTHGGFYRHFDTKEALVAAALQSAFDQVAVALEARFDGAPDAAVAGHRAHYLSQAHVDNPAIGCPIAALGGDVARGTDALKAVFGTNVGGVASLLARGMPGSSKDQRAGALRELAMLAGAVMIARASDPETALAVLSACRGDAGDA